MKKKLIKALSIVLGASVFVSCGEQPITPTDTETEKRTSESVTDEEISHTSSLEESTSETTSYYDETTSDTTTVEPTTSELPPVTSTDITITSIVDPVKEYSASVKLDSTHSTINVELSNFSDDFKSLAEVKVLLKKDGEIVNTSTSPVEELVKVKFDNLLANTQYTIEVYAKDELIETKTVTTNQLAKFDATLKDAKFVYDGNEHKLAVEGTIPENTKITYQNNDKVDAGEYQVKATLELDGYETMELSAVLTIEKADHSYESAIPEVLKAGTKIVYNSKEAFHIEFNNEVINAVFDEDLKLYVASFNLVKTEDNINNYLVVFEENNNYNPLRYEGSLTLNTFEFEGLAFEDLKVDYDGNEHEILVSNLPEGASVIYDSNVKTNAGVYEATAVVSKEGYETITLRATLTINKAKVYFNKEDHPSKIYYNDTLKYNANVPFVAKYGDETIDAVLSDDGLYRVSIKMKLVGKVDVELIAAETANYKETSWTHKQFTVNQITMKSSVTITGDNLDRNKDKNTKSLSNGGNTTGLIGVYSGNDYVVTFDSNAEFNVLQNDVIVATALFDEKVGSYIATISQKDIGEYIYTVKNSDDYGVKAYSANFKLTVEVRKAAKIEKNIDKVEYRPEGYDLVLSQDALNGVGFSVTNSAGVVVDAVLNEETKRYEYKEHITNVGSYVYKITSQELDGYAAISQDIGATIQKAFVSVRVEGNSDFTYDGDKHSLRFVSEKELVIEVNKKELTNISETEGQFIYEVDTTNAGSYEVVVLKDDNYDYPEEFVDFVLTVSKSEEVVSVTLDDKDSLSLQADGSEHNLVFKAKLPFNVFDSKLNEYESEKDEFGVYLVQFKLKEAATYEYTWEFDNKDSFVKGSEDIKTVLMAEALPEFSYKIDLEEKNEFRYDGTVHKLEISEASSKAFTVSLLFEIGSKSDIVEYQAKEGKVEIELLNAGKYTVYITSGEYSEEKEFVVNKAVLPFNVFEVVDNNGNEELTEYLGLATKVNSFVIRSSVPFVAGLIDATFNESLKLYEARVTIRKSETLDLMSYDDNYLDDSVKFDIVLPELVASVYVYSADGYVLYDGSQTVETQFEIRSEVAFKIGDKVAKKNDDGLYVLEIEFAKSQDVTITSMDEYFVDTKISVNVKEVEVETTTFDFTDKRYKENFTTTVDGVTLSAKLTNAGKSGDMHGICVGTGSAAGKIELTFTDVNGNKKNVKSIKVNLNCWHSGGNTSGGLSASHVSVAGSEKYDFKVDDYEITVSKLSTSIIVIESKVKDYRFFVNYITIEWE